MCKKLYSDPECDSTTSLILAEFCNQILNDVEAERVDTFLCCPGSNGNVLNMTKCQTQVTSEETMEKVTACECPVPVPEYLDLHGTIQSPDPNLACAKVDNDQALEDSSHLWKLFISFVDPKILIRIQECLGNITSYVDGPNGLGDILLS